MERQLGLRTSSVISTSLIARSLLNFANFTALLGDTPELTNSAMLGVKADVGIHLMAHNEFAGFEKGITLECPR